MANVNESEWVSAVPALEFDDDDYSPVDATFVDTEGVDPEELWAAELPEDDSLTLAEIIGSNDLPSEFRG